MTEMSVWPPARRQLSGPITISNQAALAEFLDTHTSIPAKFKVQIDLLRELLARTAIAAQDAKVNLDEVYSPAEADLVRTAVDEYEIDLIGNRS